MAKGKTTGKEVKYETFVSLHNCVHAYQDEKYGPGKRVFNKGNKETCTVCGKPK